MYATRDQWSGAGTHLDVVKFLQENRSEGCSRWAIEASARFRAHRDDALAMTQYLTEHHPEAIHDPTAWQLNSAVNHVRSVWAQSAALSDDPVQALRAAVVQLSGLDAFKKVHAQKHPAGCLTTGNLRRRLLLELAIEEKKDDFAVFLVESCEHARASIGYEVLSAAGSDSRPLNCQLLDLLMAKRSGAQNAHQEYKNLLQHAAKESNMSFMKALLERGVPCSHEVLMEALYGELFEVGVYLMEKYPELISAEVMQQVAYRGEHEYLFKLQAAHPQLSDMSMADEILCGENTPAYTTWKTIRSLYERCSSMPLNDETGDMVWEGDHDDVLLFMWLVWQDPKLGPSLAAADRFYRLRLYSRLRTRVPSLFEDVPATIPWCCQLRYIRQQVETGKLTLADVERAHNEAMPPDVDSDSDY